MRAFPQFAKRCALVVLLAVAGCGGPTHPIPCVNPAGAAAVGVTAISPALECPSRICLVAARPDAGGGTLAICTASCTVDEDCRSMNPHYCAAGYACATASGFPQKLCLCRDYVDAGS
jgi:hypothetical protein